MTKILTYINFILLIILSCVVGWLYFNKKENIEEKTILQPKTEVVDQCGEECRKAIEDAVLSSLTTIPDKTVSITPAPVVKRDQVVYLPLTGPISTTSTSWYDVPGTEFYLDFSRDYGSGAYANWDAYLKIAHGNGSAYARIYDVTNNIAVNGSEVLVTNSSDLVQVSSQGLSFWNGRNLYRVQLKSLNTFEVTFGSGRIKIVY